MTYLIVSFDLIAGLLVGIHLWVPEKYRQKWDIWLLRNLAPEGTPVDEKTVKGSIIITTLVVIGILVWGFVVDIGQGNFTSQELLDNALLVIVGIPIAVILLYAVMALHQQIEFIHRIHLVSIIATLGLVVVPLTLLLINVTSKSVDAIIVGFVFSLALMILTLQLLPIARKFFTFESGVLARLGVTIFIIGRFIQIANL